MANHPARSRSACLREGFASCIRLPLMARGEVLGLLNIQSTGQRHFTAEDEELLIAIGDQIGIAIANAQLIDDAEQGRATLDSVMSSMVDGLILVDRRGRIAYVNPCTEEMLGLLQRTRGPGPGWARSTSWPSGVRRREQLRPNSGLQPPTAGHARRRVCPDRARSRTLQARFFPIHDAGGRTWAWGCFCVTSPGKENWTDEVAVAVHRKPRTAHALWPASRVLPPPCCARMSSGTRPAATNSCPSLTRKATAFRS